MLEDVVLDTNVLKHADDPREIRREDAIDLVLRMFDASTTLAIDEGFALGDSNTSLIGKEYLDNLVPGMLGLQLLVELVDQARLKPLSIRSEVNSRRQINQLVRNKRDRTFLLVALETVEKIFVSHDFDDFDVKKRKVIEKKLNVQVVDACVCCPLLN